VGLLVRHRARLCWSFLAYSSTSLVGNRLVMGWPEVFFTPWFWSLKASVYSVLCAAVAIEIVALTFSEFPRARRRILTAAVSVACIAGFGLILPGDITQHSTYLSWLTFIIPSIEIAILFVYALILGFAFYYRIPLHPFHRGLMVGFALYFGADPAVLAL